MATVADLIDDIRIDLWDEDSTRWSDSQLTRLIGKAARRVNLLMHEHKIPIGMSVSDFSTVADQAAYSLPSDFGTPEGLYRNDTNERLIQASMDEWYRLDDQSEATAWTVWSRTQFKIAGTPSTVISMSLRYWPVRDTSTWTTGTTVPWSDTVHDLITEYAALRCKNTDEMDLSRDLDLLRELEEKVMNFYRGQTPFIGRMMCWDTTNA